MRASRTICVVCVTLVVAAGCGRETYERRLEESKHYFTYLDKLNQNLAAPWAGRGIKLRVPKQFQEIAGPKPKAKKPASASSAP